MALSLDPSPLFAQAPSASGEATNDTKALPNASLPPDDDASKGLQQSHAITCGPAHLARCLRDVANDQAGIWTSPLRLHSNDLLWLAPLAGATAAAIHYDASAQQALGTDRTRINASKNVSLFGSTYSTLTESGAIYFLGRIKHDDHLAETGRLGAEAVIDATLVAEALKLATNRERPDEGNGTGRFWPHGTRTFSDSFPSGHALGSWALARVIASEYPNTWTQVGAYAFATAITVSRVTAQKHFPSDALVGSAFGYLIGGYVVRHHSGNAALGFSFTPVVDRSTHTYGASIELRPDQLHFHRILRFAH